jgi:hypothetical protein
VRRCWHSGSLADWRYYLGMPRAGFLVEVRGFVIDRHKSAVSLAPIASHRAATLDAPSIKNDGVSTDMTAQDCDSDWAALIDIPQIRALLARRTIRATTYTRSLRATFLSRYLCLCPGSASERKRGLGDVRYSGL